MELLPCPFCGGEALPTAHLTYNWFAPVCGRCNARGPSVKIERDSDPQEMRNLMNQADENWNRRASPASVPEGFTMSEPAILPDGSGFGTMTEREATLLGKVERQSAALKLAREALFDMQDSYAAVHGWKDSFVIAATTAIAAIDSLQKGE